jgi:hypothetical protein
VNVPLGVCCSARDAKMEVPGLSAYSRMGPPVHGPNPCGIAQCLLGEKGRRPEPGAAVLRYGRGKCALNMFPSAR